MLQDMKTKLGEFRKLLDEQIFEVERLQLSDREKEIRIAIVEDSWHQIGMLLQHLKFLKEMQVDEELLKKYGEYCEKKMKSDPDRSEMWQSFMEDANDKLWKKILDKSKNL